jgi:PAS domain S-box-containing protein
MTIKNNQPGDAAALRRQAEAKWSERKKKAAAPPAMESETRRFVHELQVHQIELEMQNEELAQSRAELEAALRQYTGLYDFAPVGYFTLARDGAIHQVNLAGANLLGVERGALIKRRFGLFVSVESRPTFSAFLEKVFSTSGSKETCEVALLKDGPDPLWAHIEATLSAALRGQREVCHAVVSDITERKRAEEALRESENRLRTIVEGTQALLVSVDANGYFTYANDATARAVGYTSPAELIGKAYLHFIHPEDRQQVLDTFINQANTRQPSSLQEFRIVDTEGKVKWFSFLSSLAIKDGQVVGQSGVAQDITERKRAEQEIEALSRFPAENPNPILRVEQNGQIIYANLASEALLRLWNCTVGEYLPPDWRERVVNAARSSARTTVEVECEERVYSIMVVPIPDPGYVNLYGRDITARKQAERTLEESERKFRSLAENALIGIYRTNLKGEILYVNEALVRMMEFDSADEMQQNSAVARYQDPDERKRLIEALRQTGHVESMEFTLLTKSGQPKPALLSAVLDGEIISGALADLTALKQAEQAQSESEERFRALIENATDLIIVLNPDGTGRYVSPSVERILGFHPDELVGTNFTDFIHPDDLPAALEAIAYRVQTPGLADRSLGFRVRHKDGSYRTMEVIGNNLLDNPAVNGIVVNARDITARKRAEEALRESERELKEAQLLGQVGNWEYVIESQKITWSDQVYRLYERDPVLGPPTDEEEAAYYSPEQAQILHEYARRAIEEGQDFEYDLEATLPSGKRVYFSANMQPVKDARGRIVKLFGTVQDITERKQAEEALRESENKLRAIVEGTQALLVSVDANGHFTYANDATARAVGYTSPEELIGKPYLHFIHPEDRQQVLDTFLDQANTRQPSSMQEFRIIDTEGKVKWFSFLSSLAIKDGQVVGQSGVAQDITERKQAEEDIKKQLDELQRWHSATLGRENRIIDLKREVNELLAQAGKPPRYPSAEMENQSELE